MSLPGWWPDWSNEVVVIVASGPSASACPLSEAKGKARFVTVNDSWKLAPWADIAFACDIAWWDHNAGLKEFPGIRLSTDPRILERNYGVDFFPVRKMDDRMLLNEPGVVGWGGNSGFQALNLVAHFRPRKTILVGYDMTLNNGVHWHGLHSGKLNNPKPDNVLRWRRAMDNAAEVLREAGIHVVNACPDSALINYEKVRFMDAVTE